MVVHRHTYAQSSKKYESYDVQIPTEFEQDDALLSHYSPPTVNVCAFCSLVSATFFTYLCFLVVILLFKMALEHRGPFYM